MSEKDFHVPAEDINVILTGQEVEIQQNAAHLHSVYGAAAVQHHFEDRVDILTMDLAYCIARHQFPEDLKADPLLTVRRIVEDLEPRTSHLAGDNRFVTVWKNVGIEATKADLDNDYVPVP